MLTLKASSMPLGHQPWGNRIPLHGRLGPDKNLIDEALLLVMKAPRPTPAKMWWSSIATGNYGCPTGIAVVFAGEQASPARRIYVAGVFEWAAGSDLKKVLLI